MFFTPVNIPNSPIKINYHHKLMTLGSCFAENIGKKLDNAFFQTSINPFGVLYNPLSVSNSIEKLIGNKPYSESDVFEHQSLWRSFSHSTLFAGETREICLETINHSLLQARCFLQKTDFLLITFGTAWIFEEIKSRSVVANCHKMPAKYFNRRRLTVDEIYESYTLLLSTLHTQYPHLQVIFTVSPIRHFKDGAHENNLSKSILHLAIEKLIENFQFSHYFPAYEIQMDELRDYRFYAADMIHPSETAIDYIWQKFSQTYFEKQTQEMKKELEQLRSDLNHRPFNIQSDEYQLFMQNIEKRKTKLKEKFPELGLVL